MLVARARKTHRERVKESADLVGKVGGRLLGVVLNFHKLDREGSGYEYDSYLCKHRDEAGLGGLDSEGLYCQCKYMTQKEDRLQIRVDQAAKRILEDAAQGANMTLSAFVLQAAIRQAEDFVAERSLIRLSPSGAAAFAEALARPAEVNARLAEALARPRKFAWLD